MIMIRDDGNFTVKNRQGLAEENQRYDDDSEIIFTTGWKTVCKYTCIVAAEIKLELQIMTDT